MKTPNTYSKCMDRVRELNNANPATEAEYADLKASQAAERQALRLKMEYLTLGQKRKTVRWAIA